VHRQLRLLNSLQLGQLLGELQALVQPGQLAAGAGSDSMQQLQVPSADACALVLRQLLTGARPSRRSRQACPAGAPSLGPSSRSQPRRLRAATAGCRLLEALGPALLGAASPLAAQLSLSYFMPLALTCLSVLARIKVGGLVCSLAWLVIGGLGGKHGAWLLLTLHRHGRPAHAGAGPPAAAGLRQGLQRRHGAAALPAGSSGHGGASRRPAAGGAAAQPLVPLAAAAARAGGAAL
jgi:hypothetical protein